MLARTISRVARPKSGYACSWCRFALRSPRQQLRWSGSSTDHETLTEESGASSANRPADTGAIKLSPEEKVSVSPDPQSHTEDTLEHTETSGIEERQSATDATTPSNDGPETILEASEGKKKKKKTKTKKLKAVESGESTGAQNNSGVVVPPAESDESQSQKRTRTVNARRNDPKKKTKTKVQSRKAVAGGKAGRSTSSPTKRREKKPSKDAAVASMDDIMRQTGVEFTQDEDGKTLSEIEGFSSVKDAMLRRETPAKKGDNNVHLVFADQLEYRSLDVETGPIPALTHGLDRVLFNPGLYHLQDPRSRVYNFDPYIEMILPVSEFDWSMLNKFMTPSNDKTLLKLAENNGVKYFGSTSSMSSTLTHFHYLLSYWRPFTSDFVSRGFEIQSHKYTNLTRAPVASFLRWNNGVYAIDADKEWDTGNILQLLGHSLEKLLTHTPQDFERYKSDSRNLDPQREPSGMEAYRYSKGGDFLIRSQLDAQDPRLPGTGVFDLKTRAVVSIRMEPQDHEKGTGYELRFDKGLWESFEREYFDMVRANFIKYSLQVRMGKMDGIFVAYHNVQRLFGFQYISLSEMDMVLHGQHGSALGDQELMLSLELLGKALEKVTERFPEQSVRLHFETRDTKIPFMYIFAEPVEEEEIVKMQEEASQRVSDFHKTRLGINFDSSGAILDEESNREWEHINTELEDEISEDESGDDKAEQESTTLPNREPDDLQSMDMLPDEFSTGYETRDLSEMRSHAAAHALDPIESDISIKDMDDTDPPMDDIDVIEAETTDAENVLSEDKDHSDVNQTDAADIAIASEDSATTNNDDSTTEIPSTDSEPLESETKDQPQGPLLALVLVVRNKVNGSYVERPSNLRSTDEWSVEYSIKEISDSVKARKLYEMCKNRRKKHLYREEDSAAAKNAAKYFRDVIKQYVQRGKKWRVAQDRIDNRIGKVVFKSQGNEGENSLADELASQGVDGYLQWLYGKATSLQRANKSNKKLTLEPVDDYLGWLYGNQEGRLDDAKNSGRDGSLSASQALNGEQEKNEKLEISTLQDYLGWLYDQKSRI